MAVIGIDVGTSGVRACLLDTDGSPLASERAALPVSHRAAPGHHEQDPERWWQACLAVLRRLAETSDQPITGLAVDGTSGTAALDTADGPQAWMYDDSRAAEQAQRLTALAPSGHPACTSSGSLAKLLYARQHGIAERIEHPAEWLAARLGAERYVCDENNALKLGYDAVARGWPDWLEPLRLPPGILPPVVGPGTVTGHVRAEVAAITGLPTSCRIHAGTTDSTAACLATGPLQVGTGITVLGSTLVIKQVCRRPIFASGPGIYSHRVGPLWLAGGASNSGGRVLRQFFDDSQLAKLSAQIDPDTDSGLDYYPLPAPGERFPVADPTRAPRLTPRPDSEVAFLHGLLEGVARIERQGYAFLRELGGPRLERVISIGGGATNPTWTALRARLLGVPVATAQNAEPCAGAARLCLPHQP